MIETYAIALLAAVPLLAVARWAFLPSSRLPRWRVRVMRLRLRLKLHPGRGHATVLELWLRWGRFAAWRRSGRSRRSLSAWQRRRAAEHSVFAGRAHLRHGLRFPVEEHAVIIAPPRTFKTAYLADVILHYPGPGLSTTTKADVFELTSGVRAGLGPVHVFNPQGIGGVPSTFRWNPLDGCEVQAVAIRRADGFAHAVSMEGTEESSFWSSKASSYLRGLFHAAALAGGDMRLVVRWALGDAQDAEDILSQAGAGQWALELGELRGEAARTAATIRMVLSRALSFMTDPDLALSVLPGCEGFDIGEFLRGRGTLYMIADSDRDDSPLAPLFACMATEVHWLAAQAASRQPGGRLDPPLLLALDEIVQTCPVPLPAWCADSGGKGIQIISVAHGEAQLATRWREHGKQVILDTAGVRLFLPGIGDVRTLEMASKLCGQTALRERGQEHHSRHDVMTPDMIRQLPAGYALILRGGLAPVVTRLPVAWKDPAYRKARRRGAAVAPLVPAPLPAALSGDGDGVLGQMPAWPVTDHMAAPGGDSLAGREHRVPDLAAAAAAADHPWSQR